MRDRVASRQNRILKAKPHKRCGVFHILLVLEGLKCAVSFLAVKRFSGLAPIL
jgi:hypothetical protein